ncbi:MAG: GAF and ANTAR domain-containing protein [Nocardioidaceae bacterium]
MSQVSTERLVKVFVEVADTLVDEFDVIEFMAMVTARTTEVANTDAAGLLLADAEGLLQFVAASDESAKMLELFQVQTREGPCQDCYRQAAPVINAHLSDAAGRWPQFAPRAVSAGFQSVHAFPLRLRGEAIGALNLFGAQVGQMSERDVHIVQALSDVATIGLLQERAIARAEIVAEQLRRALRSRIVLEQAKGALAQRRGIGVDEAFVLMRAYARQHNRRISQLAESIVNDPAGLPDLTDR